MSTLEKAGSSSIDGVRGSRGLTIAAWVTTAAFALMMTFSGILYWVAPPPLVAGIQHLGYPPYFVRVLGIAKLLGVAAILAPRTRTLREWAYAGFTFDTVAAIASHLLSCAGGSRRLHPRIGDGVVLPAPRSAALSPVGPLN